MNDNFMVGLPPGMSDQLYLLFVAAIVFGVLLGPPIFGPLFDRMDRWMGNR